MACNVVRYQYKDQSKGLNKETDAVFWGVHRDGIYPISGSYATTARFLEEGKQQAFALQEELQNPAKNGSHTKISLDTVDILPPITNPCQVLCQGANYRQHMIESGMNPDDKKFNMIFNKSAASITSYNGNIVRPEHVKLLDYEIELGLVIGTSVTQATQISDDNLHRFVAAIVIGNDVSARDIQIPQMQFFKGKSYRTFCPVGPYLCLLEPDDFTYLSQLNLQLTVNGEARQQDSTANLVFKPAETLTELSQIADLNMGDLILTGTPAGCAMRAPSARMQRLGGLLKESKKWQIFNKMQAKRTQYLQPGDIVESRIFSADDHINLGVQRNLVIG
jgi:2-keto-4-pentenoate hydratase/2-oxohepta-3-ene-1,7-dioic acid hydratase in catechol pathway